MAMSVSVVFALPEPSIPAVRAALGKGRGLAVEARDRENRAALATGDLRILDNRIDVSTGTVKAKAMFENRDTALFPNQFVNVRVRIDTIAGALVVPVSAVQPGHPSSGGRVSSRWCGSMLCGCSAWG